MPEVIAKSEKGYFELHSNGGIWWTSYYKYLISPGGVDSKTIEGIEMGFLGSMKWYLENPILENE